MTAVVALGAVAGCASDDDPEPVAGAAPASADPGDPATGGDATGVADTTDPSATDPPAPVTRAPASSATAVDDTAEAPERDEVQRDVDATSPPTDADVTCEHSSAPAPLPEHISVGMADLGEVDGVRVRAAEYPLPDYDGNPWSQWGEGLVLPDGRFVSAVGDHQGRDGTTWFYEYDPATDELTRTVEVSDFLGHEDGDWGYGKIHAPMLLAADCTVITATYWGSRRGLELGGSYSGDHLVRYDPTTRTVEDLGVPVEGYGLPSLSISPDRRWIFGEAVDPASEPEVGVDLGVFFVADAATGAVSVVDDRAGHGGFRDIIVTADGEAVYANWDATLGAVRPDGSTRTLEPGLPSWLRAATPTRTDGPVYAATRRPEILFRYTETSEIEEMGELEGYVASLGLSPDGSTVYYAPGAHGDGPELGGTPLIAVDAATGDREVLVRLNEIIEPALGLTVGGSYSVVADPSGERVYVGLNAGEAGSDETFGHVVLAVVDLTG